MRPLPAGHVPLEVSGSPAGCRAAAEAMTRLAAALTGTEDAVAGARSDAGAAWWSPAGEAFRARSGELVRSAEQLGTLVRTLAAGLSVLADRLDAVGARLTSVRAAAAAAGALTLDGRLPRIPLLGWPSELVSAHARIVGEAEAALADGDAAQQSWAILLVRVDEAHTTRFPPQPRPREPSLLERLPGPTPTTRGAFELLWKLTPISQVVPEPPPLDELPELPRLDDEDVADLGTIVTATSPFVALAVLARFAARNGREAADRNGAHLGRHPLISPLKRGVDRGLDQLERDRDEPDIGGAERVARSVLVGLASGAGGYAGVAACTVVPVGRAAPLLGGRAAKVGCEQVGGTVGEKASRSLLHVADERAGRR